MCSGLGAALSEKPGDYGRRRDLCDCSSIKAGSFGGSAFTCSFSYRMLLPASSAGCWQIKDGADTPVVMGHANTSHRRGSTGYLWRCSEKKPAVFLFKTGLLTGAARARKRVISRLTASDHPQCSYRVRAAGRGPVLLSTL